MENIYQYEINEDILYAKYIFPREPVSNIKEFIIINIFIFLLDNN
jgi:hypothetical protein